MVRKAYTGMCLDTLHFKIVSQNLSKAAYFKFEH